MKLELCHECEIGASAETVWEVLTDTAAYPRWNPFIVRLAGDLQVGRRLEVRIAPPGGRPMTFRPRVLVVLRARELRWLGHLAVRGMFDGEHRFELEPIAPDRVRVVQAERFTGLLVRPLRRMLRRTEQGFAQMNEALAAEVGRRTAVELPG